MTLKSCFTALIILVCLSSSRGAVPVPASESGANADKLRVITPDPRLHLAMHDIVGVMAGGGRQPFLFCTAKGTLLCQAQFGNGEEPFRSKNKAVYPIRLGMNISRDGGATWSPLVREKDHDDVNLEGSALNLANGGIYLLDSYVEPNPKRPDHGIGEVWTSPDDFRTWHGPSFVDFYLPQVAWTGSTDDYGRTYDSARLHRSILALPNGDWLATMYSRFLSDTAPSAYMPTMMKGRTFIVRSRDRGRSWSYLSTVAADGGVGTEGFGEGVLVRVSQGGHAGRLICLMRTGRDLYGAHSDDNGATWSRALPVTFPGIDIRDTASWAALFPHPGVPDAIPDDSLIGDVVDPDAIEMHDGTLVCAIGVRVPARLAFKNWRASQNGDYLAFSCDGGDTWSEVVQFRSGKPTTHYMGLREISPGTLYVVYDDSIWGHPGEALGFRLDVSRTR